MNYKVEPHDIKGKRVDFITIQTNEQNSFTKKNLLEFQQVIEEIRQNDQVKAAVITSENEKFFSNGMDAQNIIDTPQERLADEMGSIVKFFNYLVTFDKPLVAELAGHAMGGGAVVTLACDYKFMLQNKGRISFTEVFFGLPLPGTFVEKAKISMLAPYINDAIYGGIFKADEAKKVGLITDTAEDKDELRKKVLKKLDAVLRVPPSAFAATKMTLHKHILDTEEYHMTNLAKNFDNPVIMGNLLEAMSALKEKRRPEFK